MSAPVLLRGREIREIDRQRMSSVALAAAAGAAVAGCHTSTAAGYNDVGEHGDDDDDAESTVFDQVGGRHADSSGLIRDHSVLPGGGVRDRAGGAGLWGTE